MQFARKRDVWYRGHDLRRITTRPLSALDTFFDTNADMTRDPFVVANILCCSVVAALPESKYLYLAIRSSESF